MRRFGGKERWGEVRGVKEGETERRFKKKKRWQREGKVQRQAMMLIKMVPMGSWEPRISVHLQGPRVGFQFIQEGLSRR